MNGLRYAWIVAVLSLCGIVATPARAEVSTTGDTKDANGYFYAGYNANTTGDLTIDAGSVFSRDYGYLGSGSSSTGTATINGTGSKWVNSYYLYAGWGGSGTLRVESGGQVSNITGYLGYNSGSTGTAIVTGAGSTWTNSDTLYVGYNGSGALTVSDGGVVSAKMLYASLSDLYGNGTITVQSGGILDADLVFDAAHGAQTTVGFGSGGTLQFTADGKSILGIGRRQSGSLRIAEGSSVTSTYGYLGYNSGSTGTATITGAGSTWTNSGNLYVGRDGTGSLTVSDGGVVSAKTLYASLSDLYGNGTIMVQSGGILDADLVFDAANDLTQTLAFGSGGMLQFTVNGTSDLGVGYKQSGSLRIADGRSVTSTTGYLSYKAGSTGMAVITGTGSKWVNSGDLYVGSIGSGTLRVEAGGQVSNRGGYLGYNSGSTGTAIVAGAGSKWTNSGDLYVGRDGTGSLTVSDGGVVSAKTLYASLDDVHGDGTITASGVVLDVDLSFDAAHGLAQTLTFGSGGTLQFTIDGTGGLGAGHTHSGLLRITGGRSVASTSGYLGYKAGSTGTATITGAGSKWTTYYDLVVGRGGSGSLRVEAAGQVSSYVGILGYNSGSTGTATITGPGSKWTTSYDLVVGRGGSGTLRVEAGAQASGASGYLGNFSGSTGTAIVTGTGSKWTNSDGLFVGRDGRGNLTVSDGGLVSANWFYASLSDLYGDGSIIVQSGAYLDGDLIVDATVSAAQTLPFGTGGILQLPADGSATLRVGYKRSGSLRIADGRSLTSSTGYLGYNSGSTGEAIITGAGSKWTNSGELSIGGSYSGYNAGSGILRVEAGGQVSNTTGCLGYNSGSTGAATITGAGSKWTNSGSLIVGSGTLRVEAGGQVSNTTGCLGYNSGSTGTATITGAGSKWTNSYSLYVGSSGSGTLRLEAGGQVSSSDGHLGYSSGSTGTAIITGAGSTWTNSGYLYVGHDGSGTVTVSDGGAVSAKTLYASLSDLYGDGTITVQSGGILDANLSFDATHDLTQTLTFGSGGSLQLTVDGASDLGVGYKQSGSLRIADGRSVASTHGYLGYKAGSTGTATVSGAGSAWTNTSDLYVGSSGSGTLTVSDGGQVTARSLSINSQSTVRLHVSGDRMLVLSSLSNNGNLSLLADAFLPGGTYKPITGNADRPVSWSGTGTVSVAGGAWNSNARTFTVVPSTPVDAGTPAEVASGLRLLITDPTIGERAGISFGTLTSPASLTSLPLPQTEQAALIPMLGSDATILSAWSFTGQLAGDEALLSFDIGLGEENLRIWRLTSTGWSEYTPDMLTYDSNGIVSFTIDPASLNSSAYAITVPEPAGLSLLAFAAVALLRRRPLARGRAGGVASAE